MPPKKPRVIQLAKASSGRQTTRSQTWLRKTRIFNLPVELLRTIFLTYFDITHAPLLLLLVCRQWRDIALNISSLWNTIILDPSIGRSSVPNFEKTIQKPIICFSLKHLQAAGKRAGELLLNVVCNLTKFDTYARDDPDAGSWIAPRCRSLYVLYTLGDFENFVTSFTNLVNLEEMGLVAIDSSNFRLRQFLINAEKTAPKLTKLRIANTFPPEFEKHRVLLARLRTLEVTAWFGDRHSRIGVGIFEHLKKIEVLKWPHGAPSNLSYISKTLRSLSISSCLDFPSLNFPRLVSLQLKCVDRFAIEPSSPDGARWQWTSPIHFPALEHLDYTGIWSNLALIQAPLLLSLIVDLQDFSTGVANKNMIIKTHLVTLHSSFMDTNIGTLLSHMLAQVLHSKSALPPSYSDIGRLCIIFALLFLHPSPVQFPQLQTFTLNTLDRDRMSRADRKRIHSSLESLVDQSATLRKVNWTWDIEDEGELLSKGSMTILK